NGKKSCISARKFEKITYFDLKTTLFLSTHTFLPQKESSFLGKNRIFATIRFHTQYAFPESGKRFFASKMSNSDSPHVFTPIGVISEKIFTWLIQLLCSSSSQNFENVFTWVAPLPPLCSS